MKIGIITFHNTSNYGAALQCQASLSAISSINNNTVILDYSNQHRNKIYDPFNRVKKSKNILELLLNIITLPGVISRNRSFKKFRENYLKKSISRLLFICFI